MTWTVKHELDVHDDRGSIVATAETPELAQRLVAMAAALETLRGAKLQIEYLHEKFQETGSGNAILARINAALATIDGTERRR